MQLIDSSDAYQKTLTCMVKRYLNVRILKAKKTCKVLGRKIYLYSVDHMQKNYISLSYPKN